MCPTYAAARPPVATRVLSGDTSGEGDTAGAGGQDGQTTDHPTTGGSRASSRADPSSGADEADEDGDENEEDSPTDRAAGAAHDSPPGTPEDVVILPKVRTVISTDSVGMQALGTMACRFLTEQEAKRLEAQKALPLPDVDSHGEVQAPSRHDFLMDSSSLGRTRLVGVPALQDHRRQGFHTRDGYGGLESLIQVEELDCADMLDLQEFFSDDNPVVADLILSSRASTSPGDELESMRHSIPAQREMATLLSEYGVDRLAERTFSTVSILRRVLDRYRRVCRQLDASPSQSRQDALKAQDQLHAAKLSFEFDRAQWESERQQSADAATYTAERYQDDVKELVHEHNANKRSLQEEVSKLRQELEDSQAYQRILDRRARESRFDVTDLMNFLGNHATLACNWVRLRDLLQHYQDRTPVPQSWQTVIATTMGDDPLSQPGAFTGLSHPDDQDGESKQEDNPDSSSDSPSKRRSSRRRSSDSFSTPSDPKRTSKRNSHKAPATPQLRPLERVEDSSSCLPEGTPPVWSMNKARGSLPGPIMWDDLRLDVQRLMCSGVFLKGAVS
ncbi:hypothetical protein PR001_g25009 [Phytophthora rubi]|uniref:Uncharacterized protein n=1 Tax=Phytophthora rubi TaxID=129364 RepID=A0A6A3I4N6_9STRA|nr:hypothetical protein PR001_g25009 [Phytophthora rubi]